jgi:thiol-disulfide isomerase/thioredoxin
MIKIIKHNAEFWGNKLYSLFLLLAISFLFTCQKNNKEIKRNQNPNLINRVNDSVIVSVDFNDEGNAIINVSDIFLHNYSLGFYNGKKENRRITHTFPMVYSSMVIEYGVYISDQNKIKNIKQNYLVSNENSKLFLEFDSEKYLFKENGLSVDSIAANYRRLSSKIFQSDNKGIYKKELDTLYTFYNNIYIEDNNMLMVQLNDIYYFEKLQMIRPLSLEIDDYIKSLSKPIACNTLRRLLFGYVENRINDFDYENLNPKNFSEEYINLLSKGVFSFLRFEDNKGNNKFPLAKKWLKETSLYANNKSSINKEIEPLNNVDFKKILSQLWFFNKSDETVDLEKIIKQNPSNYYLIDFWATWCAPCVRGIKIMNEMELPKNVKVISISVDKEKDRQKWIKTTNKLEQSITYWLDETNDKTREFMKFIEMQSIPRYILIDKNMNLIDQAFYHPQEPQFLSKLQDVKNYKYW